MHEDIINEHLLVENTVFKTLYPPRNSVGPDQLVSDESILIRG